MVQNRDLEITAEAAEKENENSRKLETEVDKGSKAGITKKDL